MKLGAVFVLSHDSIGLGEDGPTHQPIEHVASLRLIPHMTLWRPCDAVETHAAWVDGLQRTDGPTCLALTRQALPHQARDAQVLANVSRGGYVLADADAPQLVLIATGSEVALAMAGRDRLQSLGWRVRVVSMPSTSVYDRQDRDYRDSVLLPGVPRIAIEAGVTEGWWRYVGSGGRVLGIDQFGASAPAKELFAHFGFTPERVVQLAQEILPG